MNSQNLARLKMKMNNKSLHFLQKILPSVLLILFCTLLGYGQPQSFISVWKTDNPGASDDTEITLPVEGWYAYSYAPENDPNDTSSPIALYGGTTIIFPEPGTYILKMTPFYEYGAPLHRIEFNNSGDKEKLIEITQWGDTEWSSFGKAFYGAENLEITADDTPDLTDVTDMSYAFAGINAQSISNINDWDVSNVTNMRSMFNGTENFNSDIGDWDISNVTNIRDMFYNAAEFNQPLNDWDVGNVTDMRGVFKGAVSFNQDLNSWNVSNVTNTAWMFRDASAFNKDISNWDVSGVNSEMNNMFEGATSFNQTIDSWDVSNVEQMNNMFRNATAFNQNLGNWNTNSLTTAVNIFNDSGMSCEYYSLTLHGWAENSNTATDITLGADGMEYSPEIIDAVNYLENDLNWTINGHAEGTCSILDWDTAYVTIWKTDNSGDSNDQSIEIPAGGKFDYSWKEVNDSNNFGTGSGTGFTTIDFGSSGTYELSIIPKTTEPFNLIQFDDQGDKEKLLEITQWGDIEWTSFDMAYTGASNLEITANDTPNLSQVLSMYGAFGITNFSTASEMNNWDTHNIENMGAVFAEASSFNQDISNWNTENVESMDFMFFEASSFNQDIGNWNTQNVRFMDEMFNEATSFNQNLENWYLSNLEAGEQMFDQSGMTCENYSKILQGWANNPNIASNITLGAEAMEYSTEIEESRNILVNDLGWTIVGDSEGTCTLSVNSEMEITFDIYPNPVQGMLHINGLEGYESIKIFDLNGRLIQSFTANNQQENIDMNDFTSGIYFLNIETENQVQTTQKIIKQ